MKPFPRAMLVRPCGFALHSAGCKINPCRANGLPERVLLCAIERLRRAAGKLLGEPRPESKKPEWFRRRLTRIGHTWVPSCRRARRSPPSAKYDRDGLRDA